MTAIVSGMIALFSRAGPGKLNLHSALQSSDLGTRIAGYAYAPLSERIGNHRPRQRRSDRTTTSPFRTVLGLRAIRKIVINEPDSLDQNSRRRLEEYGKTVGPHTDRAYELNEILNAAPKKR
jgi:hypothetical protein